MSTDRQRTKRIIPIAGVLLAAALIFALSQPCFAAQVLWSVDVAKEVPTFANRPSDDELLRQPSLSFLSDGGVLLSFDDAYPPIATDEHPHTEPFGFHVVKLDGRDGSAKHELDYRVITSWSEAAALPDGAFAVIENETLHRYSDGFREINKIPVPLTLHGEPLRQMGSGWPSYNFNAEMTGIDVSPTGSTIILTHWDASKMTVSWLDSSSLTTVANRDVKSPLLRDVVFSSFALQGSDAAAIGYALPPPHAKVIEVVTLISPSEEKPLCEKCERAYFVNDNLLIYDYGSHFDLVDLSGRILGSARHDTEIKCFSRSFTHQRFAYSTAYYPGFGFPIKTAFGPPVTRIVVYDLQTRKRVFSLKIKFHHMEPSLDAIRFALSQDGRRLVVLDHGRLTCYQID